jgi:anti-anti-sigma factor
MLPQPHCLPDATVIELDANPCRDSDQVQRLRQRLLHAGSQAARLILDCSDVRIFSASFLGLLVSVTHHLGARPDDIALCGLDPLGAEVLRSTRLERLWRIYPTRADALGAQSGEAAPLIVSR